MIVQIPLNVVEMASPAGHFEVVAGGRRFLAMQLLVQRKRMKATEAVPCMVEQAQSARETSLDENIQSVAMNPADEVEAFATIVGHYATEGLDNPADRILRCARRFGKTAHYVEQRLRLASLDGEVLTALRDGTIGLEAAKAYAAFDDHDMQLKVFKAQNKSTWKPHDPTSIRDAMKARTYPVTDRRVLYVGLDAYREAGGRLDRDLFMGADMADALIDPSIIDRLLKEKTAAACTEIATRDGYSAALFAQRASHGYMQPPPAPEGFRSAGYGKSIKDLPK